MFLQRLTKEQVAQFADEVGQLQSYFEWYSGLTAQNLNFRKEYNTDGFTRGVLFEGKLNLGSSYGLKKAIKQLKQYSEKLVNGGEYQPRYFITYDKNARAYVYDIRTKNYENVDLVEEYDWIDHPDRTIHYVNLNEVIKYDVSSSNIIGLSQKYYEANPTSNKRDFFDNYLKRENDKFFRWTGDEKDFAHILDELNDPQSQKVLGAFYTPDRYVAISTEYLRDAIRRVLEEGFEDYVIIDRCAGSGNLEKMLTDEELSHCILNTYEAKEWIALTQIYAGRVRRIIPSEYRPDGTLLKGGDALTEEFLENFTEEFKLRDEGRLAIIMLENPPYSDTSSDNAGNGSQSKGKNITWVTSKMKGSSAASKGSWTRELVNQFIWSAYEYFKPAHYIVYGPVKYWKSNHILDKVLINGHLCNRKYFHASEAGILLAHWHNEDRKNNDIVISTDFSTDDGAPRYIRVNKIYRSIQNIIDKKTTSGFARMSSHGINIAGTNMMLADVYKKSTYSGIYLTWLNIENLKTQLPTWVANCFEFEDYTEKEVLMKSSDGGTAYQQDADFLNDCLLYTLLTNKNKCSKTCEIYPYGFRIFNRRAKHDTLWNLWSSIYAKTNVFGLDNVIKECDTFTLRGDTRDYNDPILHRDVVLLKAELKDFYITNIKPKMLQYELVK